MHENVDVRLFLPHPIFTFCLCAIIMQSVLKTWLKNISSIIIRRGFYAANSDEPVEGRYLVKAVAVIVSTPYLAIFYTDVEAISKAGQVSKYDILAKHSSCRCWHFTS